MRYPALLTLALLVGCTDERTAQDAKLIRAARAGMNVVQGVPGGKTASFTAVRLVGADTVCGMIDGNDGDGPRPFASHGQMALVSDARDPKTVAVVEKMCAGTPVVEIVSRNAQFTDLEVKH